MRSLVISAVAAVFVILLNGCTGTVPVKNLSLPPVSMIEGSITQIDEGGFTLTDDSGSIYVRAELPDNKRPDISVNDKVRVYGNLLSGQKRIFDGYVIKKPTGEQIIISNPTPHFGFVIQSSFK